MNLPAHIFYLNSLNFSKPIRWFALFFWSGLHQPITNIHTLVSVPLICQIRQTVKTPLWTDANLFFSIHSFYTIYLIPQHYKYSTLKQKSKNSNFINCQAKFHKHPAHTTLRQILSISQEFTAKRLSFSICNKSTYLHKLPDGGNNRLPY